MRILHLSDLHFGYEDGEAIAAVYRFVKSEPPDLIVVSGDLSAAGLQSELSACAEWLSSLGPPVIATPGNHDVPYFEAFARLYRPFRRFRRAARGRLLGQWRSDEVCIETANTARGWQMRLNWALGSIAPAQVGRVRRRLQSAAPGALKIVVTHHPLIWPENPALPGATHGGAKATNQLMLAGAHLFLAGHLHVMRQTRHQHQDRLACLITGGTLCTRLRGDPQGFNVIELSEKVLRIESWAIHAGEPSRLHVDAAYFDDGCLVDAFAPAEQVRPAHAD